MPIAASSGPARADLAPSLMCVNFGRAPIGYSRKLQGDAASACSQARENDDVQEYPGSQSLGTTCQASD
jgi:hypothetical protein